MVVPAVTSSALTGVACPLAIYRTGTPPQSRHGAILSRRGAVVGSMLTVPCPAPRDLRTRTSRIRIRIIACRQLTITFGADLIALGSRSIAIVSTGITASGRSSAPCDALAAFGRAAIACVAHEVMQATVATRHEITIACPLVHVRGSLVFVGQTLVGIGRRLLAVRPRLLGVRESLLTISAPLIAS